MVWNGTEISVWNMEDARMEWNGKFQEWNGRQSSILPSMGVDFLLIKQIPKGKMSLRSLVKLKYSISVRNFAPKFRCRPIKKKGLRRKLVRFQPRIPSQKKVFAAFWFYLSPEFRISCCQVGITCQKTKGADIFRLLQCQTRGGIALSPL